MTVVDKPKTYNLREAAAILGVSEPTMKRFVDTGLIRGIHDGRKYIIPVSAIAEFIDGTANQELRDVKKAMAHVLRGLAQMQRVQAETLEAMAAGIETVPLADRKAVRNG